MIRCLVINENTVWYLIPEEKRTEWYDKDMYLRPVPDYADYVGSPGNLRVNVPDNAG